MPVALPLTNLWCFCTFQYFKSSPKGLEGTKLLRFKHNSFYCTPGELHAECTHTTLNFPEPATHHLTSKHLRRTSLVLPVLLQPNLHTADRTNYILPHPCSKPPTAYLIQDKPGPHIASQDLYPKNNSWPTTFVYSTEELIKFSQFK